MASQDVRQRLEGVVAEKGCLIRCRDAPALQVVTRVGSADTIRVIFSQPDSAVPSANGGMLFARERQDFQDQIQQWLDPSRRRDVRGGTATRTTVSDVDSDADDEEDDDADE